MSASPSPPKIDLHQSPTRCPFCHEGIERTRERWVACAGCLARHHEECWNESGRCSSCQVEMRLEIAASVPAPRRERSTFLDLGASGKDKDAAIVTVAKRGQADFRTINEAILGAGI